MKRILLDSNIYGNLALENNPEAILENLQQKKEYAFYGIRELIRKELRQTPKNIVIPENVKLRLHLLHIYDAIVRDHELPVNEKTYFLAEQYYQAYRIAGGKLGQDAIIKDFCIVACATQHHLDIVISDDSHSMLAEAAKKAYTLINTTLNLPTPAFYDYQEFKRWFSV